MFAGGDAAGSVEILDVSAGSSANAGALSGPRSEHGAALMLDGRILFVGGRDADGNALSSGATYDPASGSGAAVDSALTVARVRPHLRVLFDHCKNDKQCCTYEGPASRFHVAKIL